uniref:Uncharacterized protein n=1 Tax=Anguilla anguilla TaxID=7936 RepID=A0A0E9RLQ0_ANGAN
MQMAIVSRMRGSCVHMKACPSVRDRHR